MQHASSSRGTACRWFPPRRERACRTECRARLRPAVSGGVCSWRVRRGAGQPGPPLRRACRRPSRRRNSRGPRRAASPGTARRTSGRPPPGRSRIEYTDPPRSAPRPRGGTVRAHRPSPWPRPAWAGRRRAAARRGRGMLGWISRRMGRRPTAPARARAFHSAGTARRRPVPGCACDAARGPSRERRRRPRRPSRSPCRFLMPDGGRPPDRGLEHAAGGVPAGRRGRAPLSRAAATYGRRLRSNPTSGPRSCAA